MGSEQRRRSIAEQQEMVQRWRDSGLSKAAFARRVGVSINSVHRWVAKCPAAFLEVVVAPLEPCPDLVVHLGAVRVSVPHGFDAAELRRLVDALC